MEICQNVIVELIFSFLYDYSTKYNILNLITYLPDNRDILIKNGYWHVNIFLESKLPNLSKIKIKSNLLHKKGILTNRKLKFLKIYGEIEQRNIYLDYSYTHVLEFKLLYNWKCVLFPKIELDKSSITDVLYIEDALKNNYNVFTTLKELLIVSTNGQYSEVQEFNDVVLDNFINENKNLKKVGIIQDPCIISSIDIKNIIGIEELTIDLACVISLPKTLKKLILYSITDSEFEKYKDKIDNIKDIDLVILGNDIKLTNFDIKRFKSFKYIENNYKVDFDLDKYI